MISGEFSFELTTFVAKGELIKEVKRRAEFRGQVNNITTADAKMALCIYLRR